MAILQLSKEQKLQLFHLLKDQPTAFGNISGDQDIIPFLEMIWPLRTMPSTDPRFPNAYLDAYQHLVNNNDWEIEYLFLDRLELLENNAKFNAFLETIVSPQVRENVDEIIKYIFLIEPFITKENFVFVVDSYSAEGLPVYKLKENQEGADFLFDLKPNNIPFVVEWDRTGRSDVASSHNAPTEFPAFILVFNDGWNDFSILSTFNLYYYTIDQDRIHVGEMKIISNSRENTIQHDLPQQFTQLSENFCSLGQKVDYYHILKKVLGRDFESVLYALRDASLFPDNHERFERNYKFRNSLIRYDSAEQLLRTARYLSYGYDLNNLYTFSYSFQPLYSSIPISVTFEFSNKHPVANRIYAIIGKNGTGKTQLITGLPFSIYKNSKELFIPRVPFFSKVIAVSYSIFDQFEIPKKSTSFNYVYCGLRKGTDEHFSEKGLVLRFQSSWKKILAQERLESWKRVLSNFVDIELIDYFIVGSTNSSGDPTFIIDSTKFQETKRKFSSGQSIAFYIITEIVANIRYDSLLLYDEPETHLHPNAITELMYIIYELVNEFQSYCIIATHSPVIVRELFSRNVYVLEKDEDVPSIHQIGIESFGEDIGILTDEVFGNKEVPKQYKKIIDSLAMSGHTFEQIIEQLESNQVALSLNARLYIRSSVKFRNA